MARDTLTLDQIVRTAIELLDAEGLEGLNMRALGNRLNSAATAVYWHVKNKDNLVLLATDRVWSELTLADLKAVTWRAAATAIATDLYAMFVRHPWLVQVFAAHVVYGEGKARHDDHSLAVYESAGFTGTQADQAAAAVFTYVLGNAAGAAATASLTRKLNDGHSTAEERFQNALTKAQEIAMRYPRLRARLETQAATDYAAAPDRTFEFGLRALLDGLEQELAA
ncbi:putative transcriptional regulator [Streptomyces ambofaciens ATCC 23877]|uniref:Putative transcriptional regulator n=2 Tax=Streptomyces ambofaciens (strain ATCC 23877 / 3486 / DSM 40053 / JCM 4204 / NBRC 12836 / NRRL B-2516) TaxID=278992 RepID=A0A0K2B4M8_STRA7|nr:TetR/AcrR family transcriptional regulator C-terminal domain-containing protein [Streptomyces ambofaciens]AKZ60355.1 putative transcriptional regulator [Streptomyces ambofaciens ATCC 23877]